MMLSLVVSNRIAACHLKVMVHSITQLDLVIAMREEIISRRVCARVKVFQLRVTSSALNSSLKSSITTTLQRGSSISKKVLDV